MRRKIARGVFTHPRGQTSNELCLKISEKEIILFPKKVQVRPPGNPQITPVKEKDTLTAEIHLCLSFPKAIPQILF